MAKLVSRVETLAIKGQADGELRDSYRRDAEEMWAIIIVIRYDSRTQKMAQLMTTFLC